MGRQNVQTIFKKYQQSPRTSAVRKGYLRAFEKKMIYRTTKTENPETTLPMVLKILNRFRSS